jgi:hypothetical protein
LVNDCAAETTVQLDAPGAYASIFEPAPANLRAVLRLPDTTIWEAWLKAYRKELKAILDSGTFQLGDNPLSGESCTPIMDLNVVKLWSNGTLDRLKNRLVVRGDLQKNVEEDTWSPTASFWALKLPLAHAARLKVRVRRLDFVGAFLQVKVRRRIFVKIPAIYGSIFPEFQQYWYQDLMEFLISIGFIQSTVVKCLFFKKLTDGSVIFLLNYVDDML